MKYPKVMRERIQRVQVNFREMGYELKETGTDEQSYAASFENEKGLFGECYIYLDSKFLEIAYSFSFPVELSEFVQTRMPEVLKITYEFGCYINIQKDQKISLTVFSKIYFAGLNYYALRDTMKDFLACVESLRETMELKKR